MSATRMNDIELMDVQRELPEDGVCARCGVAVKPLDLGAWLGWFVPPVCDLCVDGARATKRAHERAARLTAWRAVLDEQMGGDLYTSRRVSLPEPLECFARAGGWMPSQSAVYLTGGVGTGKTQAMAEMALRVMDRMADEPRPACPVAYMTVHGLLAAMRAREDVTPLLNAPWLFLDEIGAVALTDWGHEQMYLVINQRAASRKPTVFASNYHLADLIAWGGSQPQHATPGGRAYGVVGWDHRVTTRIMAMIGGLDADRRLPGVLTFERAWRLEVRR